MSDFAIEVTNETGGTDYRWARSNHGLDAGITGTLELATVASLRNTEGFIPSGIALGQKTEGGNYGLFDLAATDGREVLAGFLLADVKITNSKFVVQPSGKAPIAVLKHGTIARKYLPVEAQRTITALTPSTGQFVLVD
jgi:hypothetical protein